MALQNMKTLFKALLALNLQLDPCARCKVFREVLPDSDIFEIVEAYFKICRKYHVPTFEEPYYFLSEQKRRDIKMEGDMLKRTGNYCENEIRISFLEGILERSP